MKKYLKTICLCFCSVVVACLFSACNDDIKKISVEQISLDKQVINLYVSDNQTSEEEFKVSYKPANANQIDIEFFSYNQSLVEITPKKNTGDTFIVKAKPIENETAQTFIGVRMKGNVDVQASVQVLVKKLHTKLSPISNLRYNEELSRIEWDATTNTIDDGFCGYKLLINNQEFVTTGQAYYYDFKKGEKLTVQVKAISGVSELDSEYSDSISFVVLNDIENFAYKNGSIAWDETLGASGYSLKLNSNPEEILNSNTNSKQVQFNNAGVYTYKLTALGGTIEDNGQFYTCYASSPAYLTITKLSAPTNFNYQKVFTWNAVVMENDVVPVKYQVFEVVSGGEVLVAETKDISYSLNSNLSIGNHTYKVRAVGDEVTTISSDFTIAKTVNKLEAPKNLRVENGIITWDKLSDAVSYKFSFSGYYNGSTFYDDFYSIDLGSNINYFELGKMFQGDYLIKVASISDAENTVDSDFTRELLVKKLNAPDTSKFGIDDNKLVWDIVENATRYDIILNIGDQIKTDSVLVNEYEIPENIDNGKFSYQIKAIGDNTIYLTSDFSQLSYFEKLASPVLSVNNGVLTWSNIDNSSSYILNINGRDIDMKKLREFNFESYKSGLYNVKVMALGGNANSNIHLVGSFSSNYSEIFTATKYSAPTLYLQDGKINYTSPEYAPKVNLERTLNSNGSYTYTCYCPGDNSNYINSDYSESLVVWQAPNVSNLSIKNSVAIWDAIASKFEGSKFKVTLTYSDLEGELTQKVIYEGVNNSFDFTDSDVYPAGSYTLNVEIIGTSGKQGDNLILSSQSSSEIDFYRLPKPEISILGAFDLITGSFDYLPGTIEWRPSNINNYSAIGYTLMVKDSRGNIVKNYDIKSERRYNLPNVAGTYTISLEAYGNGLELLNSGFSEEKTCTKLTSAKNLRLDEYGIVSWTTDYNAENSDSENIMLGIAGMNGMPLHLRAIFILEIDGEYYNPYDFSKIFEGNELNYKELAKINTLRSIDINELKKLDGIEGTPINLSHGNHSLRVLTIPLNYKLETGISLYPVWGYDSDLLADSTSYLNFIKLEQPYGLRADRNENDEYFINFTPSLNSNVSGYEIFIKQADLKDDDPSNILISLNGVNNTTFNLTEFLNDKGYTSGSFIVKARAISKTSGVISSNYTQALTVNLLTEINLNIINGELKWNEIKNAEWYCFTFTKGSETITKTFASNITNYALTLSNDSRFTSGTYNIKVRVIGNSTSSYGNVIYLDMFEGKDYGEFVKLATPSNLEVENGLVIFNHIDKQNALSGYQYKIYVTNSANNMSIETVTPQSNDLSNSNSIFNYELPEKFPSGDYKVKVQAMGLTHYLNGEISESIVPEIVKKLDKTNVYINNGILNWSAVEGNGYLVEISGGSFYVFSKEDGAYSEEATEEAFAVKIPSGTTALDISDELTNVNGIKFKLSKGEYSVRVKVLGTNVTYLNSNYSTLKKFRKLATPQNVRVEDGLLKWNKLSVSDAPNGVKLYVKSNLDEVYRSPIIIEDNNISYFELSGLNYMHGLSYSIYLQTVGDTNLDSSSFVLGYISGDPSQIIENVQKLQIPRNAKIEYTEEEGTIGKFVFDKLDLEVKYLINIKIIKDNKTTIIENIISDNQFILSSSTLQNIELCENTQIQVQAKALGESSYFDSDFTAILTIIIPPSPIISVIEDEASRFTGRIEWSEVKVGDFTTTYVLKYQFLEIEKANALNIRTVNDVTEEIWNTHAKEILDETTNLYINISGKGFYRFKVIALIKGHDTIKSPELSYTKGYDFCLFSSGEGTKENPYVVDSAQSFNFINYNLSAHYILSSNIDFTNIQILDIGLKNNPFVGSFNGNNKIISNIKLSNIGENSSVFDYVGRTGIIKDLYVSNISIANGTNVGGIVGTNEGIISNVIVGMNSEQQYDGISSISPYSVNILNSYVGGICGYNIGTITNCKNYAIVAPKNDNAEVIAGGIAGYNAGVINNSFNYNNVGGLTLDDSKIYANMAGGIVGFNEKINDNTLLGQINNSANYGNVYSTARNKNGISQSGYAGGICAYSASGEITKCFNDNSLNSTVIYSTTVFFNMYVYAGGLVGYNENSSKLISNWTISNVYYNINGTSAQIYVGILFGQNNNKNITSIQKLYAYALSNSMVSNIGEIIPSNSTIYQYSQNETSIEEFKNIIKRAGLINE